MKKFSTFKFKTRRLNEQDEVDMVDQEVMEQPMEQPSMSGPSQFFSKLFESREMAHVYHLSVKGDMGSYAAHVALGAYYNEILEFIDDLIEIYQGQYGLVENFDIIMFVKSTRNTSLSSEDTHLQNIIDEVIALIYKTLYKLKYNK